MKFRDNLLRALNKKCSVDYASIVQKDGDIQTKKAEAETAKQAKEQKKIEDQEKKEEEQKKKAAAKNIEEAKKKKKK